MVTLEVHGGMPGSFTRNASVTTDDPVNPVISLMLKYEAVQRVRADPERLLITNFVAGAPADSREVTITALAGSPSLEIREVLTDRPDLTATLRTVEKGKQFAFVLHTKGEFISGEELQGSIRLKTNYQDQTEVVVPYTAHVIGRVRVSPPALQFGSVQRAGLKQNPASRDLALEIDNPGGGGARFTLGDIRTDPRQLSVVEVKPLADGRRYSVKFRLNPELPAGSFAGTAAIATSDAKMKLLEVAFSGQMID
jgi:hypothetical protein